MQLGFLCVLCDSVVSRVRGQRRNRSTCYHHSIQVYRRSYPMPNAKTVQIVCPHDCPDTCSMLVTVEDGRATRLRGDPDHPVTDGFLCQKGSRYLERVYHPGRLKYPMVRSGPKGKGVFRRVSWAEAIDLIATRFRG